VIIQIKLGQKFTS